MDVQTVTEKKASVGTHTAAVPSANTQTQQRVNPTSAIMESLAEPRDAEKFKNICKIAVWPEDLYKSTTIIKANKENYENVAIIDVGGTNEVNKYKKYTDRLPGLKKIDERLRNLW